MSSKGKKDKKKVVLKTDLSNESDNTDSESVINNEVDNSELYTNQINSNLLEKVVYLDKNKRRTSDIMTKFEYAKVVGLRAQQIKLGDNCRVDVGNITDPLEMARKEVFEKKVPCLQIERKLNMGHINIVELWDVNEMSIPN